MNASHFSHRAGGRRAAAVLAGIACLVAAAVSAQPTGQSPLSPPPNSPRRADSTWHALTNATVHIRPGQTLQNATVVVRDGLIVAVEAGRNGEPAAFPRSAAGARLWDSTGLHIYPGFIDAHVDVNVPAPDADSPGAHWNARITPQRSALDGTGVDERTAESLRRLGFTAAAITPRGGVFRGTGAVVSLARPASEASADRPPVYRERVYHGIAFDSSRRGGRGETPDVARWSSYPNSQMGAIALIRQTLIDADWQVQARGAGAAIARNSLDHLAAPDDRRDAAAHRPTTLPWGDQLNDEIVMAVLAREQGGSTTDISTSDANVMGGPDPASPRQKKTRSGSAMPENRGEETAKIPTDLNHRDASTAGSGERAAQRREPARQPGGSGEARGQRANTEGSARGADVTRGLPLLFDTDDELEALRAAKIAREFERPAMILGSGYEFRRLHAIVEDGLPVVLPLRFPRAPDVSSVGRAEAVELRELMTWEQAPTNPRRLDEAGLRVALTTSKLRNRNEFSGNLTRAIKHGLPPERALAMVTTNPAELLGVADRIGTIEVGKVANLVVADGPLFVGFTEQGADGESEATGEAAAPRAGRDGSVSDDATGRGRIRDVWIDGFRHEITAAPVRDHVGTWQVVSMDGQDLDAAAPDGITLTITRQNQITYRREDKEARATNVRVQDSRIDYAIDGSLFEVDAVLLLTAVVEGDMMHGTMPMPDSSLQRWTAQRVEGQAPPEARRQVPDEEKPAPAPADTSAGIWHVSMDDRPDEEVTIEIGPDNAIEVFIGGQRLPGQDVLVEGNSISFRFDSSLIGLEGFTQVDAVRDGDSMSGTADIPGLDEVAFVAMREPGSAPEAAAERPGRADRPARRQPPRDVEKEEREAIARVPEAYGYPFGPYMMMEPPEQKPTLFINATIWTAGPEGILEDGWLFIRDGEIAAVGQGGPPARFGEIEVVDLAGKHIAPGIIDCHSHTGISRGVNESGRAVSAEVRIQDVTNPDAISWYRQLASGVTAVNSLHGSANAIGGQSQTNKIRWGALRPDDKHMEGATPGIKFALGENVKQSNWGDRATVRYPQTRMGVETLIRDRFKAARDYASRMKPERSEMSSQQLGVTPVIGPLFQHLPPRRDLELEALAEVLAGERLVHCHSYRQDEILMLCRIADEFGFKIGTFQHILEGYKVADEVGRHAIGASAFSDWWAYKVEVQDAIPQAGPIMWEEGVVVSFNSDSDELARRMNGEAAKAIKYASPERPIDPNEALKFVTLNPAIQLGVADRIGSLEVGKDADFAIWSGPPLSSLSRCEATYVDGRRLFSLEDDQAHREVIQRERQRLTQKILAENRRRPGTMRGREDREEPGRFAGDESPRRGMMRAFYLDLIDRGIDPSAARPGDCGCDELEFHLH